jgi:DNA-damage-inducible protein J
MPSTNINVRIDSALKAEAQEVLGNLGMDLSTAISVYLTQVVLRRAIPFRISGRKITADDEYHLRRAFAEFEAGEKGFTIDECNERMKAAVKRGTGQRA